MAGVSTEAMATINRRLAVLGGLALAIVAVGTLGYRWLSGGSASWLDCLFMTVITVTTIGYGEVIDLSRNGPAIRAFSMAVAVGGIGVITYAIGSLTSFAVDGELRDRLRRRRMQSRIAELKDHYVLAGWGETAPAVARELARTARPFVAVVPGAVREPEALQAGAAATVVGDVDADESLRAAGVERAAGVFALCDDDRANIVIALSARRLNPSARIVACVRDESNASKMRRAGADATVSTIAIGGLRMASEMIRPTVVTFLDTMLRSADPVLRVEEVRVGPAAAGRTVGELGVDGRPATLLMALRHGRGEWEFKPMPDRRVEDGDVLVVMTTPAGAAELRRQLGS